MPLIPLRRQKQSYLCELNDRLTFKVIFRTARTVLTEKPSLKKPKRKKKKRNCGTGKRRHYRAERKKSSCVGWSVLTSVMPQGNTVPASLDVTDT
jgi:hypothetical protein